MPSLEACSWFLQNIGKALDSENRSVLPTPAKATHAGLSSFVRKHDGYEQPKLPNMVNKQMC